MNPSRISVRRFSVAAAAGLALTVGCLTTPAAAVGPSAKPATAGVQLDYLDRGLVAAGTSEGVFLSWRLLGHEATGPSSTGLTGTDFNVYRDGQKLTSVTDRGLEDQCSEKSRLDRCRERIDYRHLAPELDTTTENPWSQEYRHAQEQHCPTNQGRPITNVTFRSTGPQPQMQWDFAKKI